MAADYWAHHFRAHPDASKETMDEDFSLEDELRKADEEADELPDDFEDC